LAVIVADAGVLVDFLAGVQPATDHDVPLLTRNKSHFERVENLKLV
jgi:predicted nucleic acid-binding protein